MSVLLQRFKWIINGFSKSVSVSPKRLDGPDVKPLPHQVKPNDIKPNHETSLVLEAANEISIYIHRFHNLDLFQQGWYRLKITIRWENGDSGSLGVPARVVQYEVPELGSNDAIGVWRIDDTDHSFSTQPFRIRYAKQDILLATMVSFKLSLSKFEGTSSSAVILKFELLYAASLDNGFNALSSLETCPAAVHEFRLPPKALLGLHVYCPVHFDTFHSVLVDTSVHVSLLKSGVFISSPKAPSGLGGNGNDIAAEHGYSKQVMLVKALSNARDLLVEELQKLSNAINEPLDIKAITSRQFLSFRQGSDQDIFLAAVTERISSHPHLFEVQEKPLFDDKLSRSFDLIGNEVFHLWSTFLNFHRANVRKILEFLRKQWTVDRKAEWSIWMVHSNIDMAHQYISSLADDFSNHGSQGRSLALRKLTGDPAQMAAMRAELHRRSIAQMKINNRSIQDLHIFEDPSRVPIVIVERVVNAPLCSTSGNSFSSRGDEKGTNNLSTGINSNSSNMLSDSTHPNERILKIVVFVHGFQGHHLDLRLVRNQWLLIDPKTEFLMSEINEEKTSGDFREMGQRLAQEVVSFVKKKMDKVSRSGVLRSIKLSFVGHSIGNIILRTALTDSLMVPYLMYLHTYLSISGPHLGYLYSSNSLFNGGLWLLKKFMGTQCIHQLTFTDDPDIQNTFLYNLSKEKTLENFKNIILVASPQDGYVPYHSARIEMCPASLGDHSKKSKVFWEMLKDSLDQIQAPSSEHRVFMRCDVDFDTSSQSRNLNTIIGRAAHIEFLESDIFVKFIMWSFPDLFR